MLHSTRSCVEVRVETECVFAADVLDECVVLVPNEKVAFRPQSIYVLSPYLSSVYKLSVDVRVCTCVFRHKCVRVCIRGNKLSVHDTIQALLGALCCGLLLLFLPTALPLPPPPPPLARPPPCLCRSPFSL